MHRFMRLSVYQKALEFTRQVRQHTQAFPKTELFVLTSQFHRAADSIVLNIAEGAGNLSNREFARFLGYSIRSGFECIGCSDIALVNGYLNQAAYDLLVARGRELISMLHSLRSSLFRPK